MSKEREVSGLIGSLVEKIPGVSRRTVVQADFVTEGKAIASVRAGRKESLCDELGTARDYLREAPRDGEIFFSTERRVRLPFIGDIVVERQGLGRGPKAFDKALEILPGELPKKEQ